LLEVSQQPVGHDRDVQTHWPPTHCRPLPQAAFVPHLQTPLAQLSAVKGSQALQTPPFCVGAPQLRKLVCVVWQVEGELQQPGQPLVPLQTQVADEPLPLHTVPVGQGPPVEPQTQAPLLHRLEPGAVQLLQLPPPAPQVVVLMVVWHWLLPSQQPLGHEVASHAQPPLTHRWPLAQAAPPAPHEH
jgi:hypothetical protein